MRHKHADVIHAWAEGEEIEVKLYGKWFPLCNPPSWGNDEYRIKPKIIKKEGWVNIDSIKSCFFSGNVSHAYKTKEQADAYATLDRTACIRIEWEEEV